jgi:hypothetical protein
MYNFILHHVKPYSLFCEDSRPGFAQRRNAGTKTAKQKAGEYFLHGEEIVQKLLVVQ